DMIIIVDAWDPHGCLGTPLTDLLAFEAPPTDPLALNAAESALVSATVPLGYWFLSPQLQAISFCYYSSYASVWALVSPHVPIAAPLTPSFSIVRPGAGLPTTATNPYRIALR